MTIWYHPKYDIIGQLYPRPANGPIYYYNRSKLRMYYTEQLAYQITTSPKQYGWVYMGDL